MQLQTATSSPLPDYLNNPIGYIQEVLGCRLTPDQERIAGAILRPPYRVKAPSGHSTGKTFLAAAIVNWWFDTRDPGVCITTAPTKRDVEDLLWAEIRIQRQRARLPCHFIGDRAPEMRTSEEHYAKGYTARKGESFQGRHRANMLFVFDEDEGVDANYWTAAKSMFKPEEGNAWLAIGNPTTTTSQSYLEEMQVDADGEPSWRVISLSSLDHPNIAAQLAGEAAPIPNAVTLDQVQQWVVDWCQPILASDAQVGDFEFPPGSRQWYRPGPIGESRILGRRPSAGTFGVWSEALWAMTDRLLPEAPMVLFPRLGCDVARYGDDFTAIHARRGPSSLLHEAGNGWSVPHAAGRLMQLANQYAAQFRIRTNQIAIAVDDDGVGGGVTDLLREAGFLAIAVSAGTRAIKEQDYPNKRSELWFSAAERARMGLLSLAALPEAVRRRLKQQAMAPQWKVDSAGRRVVEPKDETKKKLGRSPDDMDAVNLAYYEIPVDFTPPRLPQKSSRGLYEPRPTARRAMLGR